MVNNNMFEKYECFMSILHENFMLELRIVHILNFHRKTVLQQTPSSDTSISGTHFFSTWYSGRLLINK